MDDLNTDFQRTSTPQSDEEGFLPWKSGDPYTFSLDEETRRAGPWKNENPWKVAQEYFSTREEVRCAAWKDEVQHLLIFSGLFSAIVTAFLVESYKTLQQDPSEVSMLLLSRISSQIEALSAITPTSATPTLLTPSLASSRRINSFWFLSLVFSLTSALVGIVALQWIREHLRPPPQGLSRRKAVPVIHMNIESLDRFRVPEIFTALPLLLLVGLVLFFVGLVDFLWNLDRVVAIPTLAAIIFTLLFLLLSTLLPGLLTLPLYHNPQSHGAQTRVPCGYKSPQAWAFLRLMLASRRILKYLSSKLRRSVEEESTRKHDVLKVISAEKGLKVDWLAHDLLWLRQRDIDRFTNRDRAPGLLSAFQTTSYRFSSLHDSVHALLEMKSNLPTGRKDELASAYKSFYELTSFSYGREVKFHRELIHHLIYNILLPEDTEHMSQYLIPMEKAENTSQEPALPSRRISRNQSPVLLDVARLLFAVYAAPSERVLVRTLTLQHIEICLRLSSYVFSGLPRSLPDATGSQLTPPLTLVDLYLAENEVSSDNRLQIAKQVLHIVSQFFQLAIHNPQRITSHDNTSHMSRYAKDFLSAAGRILSFNAKHEAVQVQHDVMITAVCNHIRTAGKADYLFLAASIYAEGFSRRPHGTRVSKLETQKMTRIGGLLEALRTYKPGFHQRTKDGDVIKVQASLPLPRGFWTFLSKGRHDSRYTSIGTLDEDALDGSQFGTRYTSRSSTWPLEQSHLGSLSPIESVLEGPNWRNADKGDEVMDPETVQALPLPFVASPDGGLFPNSVDIGEEKPQDAYIDITLPHNLP